MYLHFQGIAYRDVTRPEILAGLPLINHQGAAGGVTCQYYRLLNHSLIM
jgi:hypothetical protein